ncbi:hypothetical protein KFL_001090185 [Klebsormidium nitens]|uniref:MYND-type domain-containing protein n=1 Tax=Klebsormidium nitens TaxID=105231 RepID=A0A1Y1HUR3_KLENI|nr:hypothetical protein KFL_001090185 [Klebsormidium nitens]|eukprot:GAQ82370.1 hypothetical protein KFL_001090185 [Klebsormidium nitens]
MDGPKSTSRNQPELLRAQTQQALRQILRDSQSKDANTRLLAFQRFTSIFRKFSGPDPEESTMHVAAELLEKGLLKPIAEGLKDCVAAPWRILMQGFTILSQSEVCIKALECLALDSRTVKYILQEDPTLPAVLRALFLNELKLAERSASPPDVRVTRAILQTLPRFFMVDSAREETGRSADFLNAVMRHALRHFQDLVTVHARLLLWSSCEEQLEEEDHSLMVLLATALEYGTPAARAKDTCPPPGVSIHEDAKRLANADPSAWARARVLRTLLAQEPDTDGDNFRVRFVRPKASDGARGVEGAQKAEMMGIQPAERKKATRCSGPGCDEAETRPGEFQMCGGCRLAVYCGKDCQRRAWKAGHKETCQKTA